MKTKHKFNEELEAELIMLSNDEFIEWLLFNEIEYENPNLLEVMLNDLKKENTDV
jgi:hypothetical protein